MKKSKFVILSLAISALIFLSSCEQLNDLFAKTRLPITVTASASDGYSYMIFGAPVSQPFPMIAIGDEELAPYLDFQISVNWEYHDIDFGDAVTFSISYEDELHTDTINVPEKISGVSCNGTALTDLSGGGTPDVFQPAANYKFTWTGVDCLGYMVRIYYMASSNTTGTYTAETIQTTDTAYDFIPPEPGDGIEIDIWAYNSEPISSARNPDYSGEKFYCYYDIAAYGFNGTISIQ